MTVDDLIQSRKCLSHSFSETFDLHNQTLASAASEGRLSRGHGATKRGSVVTFCPSSGGKRAEHWVFDSYVRHNIILKKSRIEFVFDEVV